MSLRIFPKKFLSQTNSVYKKGPLPRSVRISCIRARLSDALYESYTVMQSPFRSSDYTVSSVL